MDVCGSDGLVLTVDDRRMDLFNDVVLRVRGAEDDLARWRLDYEALLEEAVRFWGVRDGEETRMRDGINGLTECVEALCMARRLMWNYLAVRDDAGLLEVLRLGGGVRGV